MNDGTLDSESIFEGLEGVRLSAVFAGKSNAVAKKHGLHKWYSVSFDVSVSVETAAALISKHDEIEAIEYNSVLKATFSPESYDYEEEAVTRSTTKASDGLPFNDILLKDQWDLITDGSLAGSSAGADVGVKDAWKLTGGDARVVVAILQISYSIAFNKGSSFSDKHMLPFTTNMCCVSSPKLIILVF